MGAERRKERNMGDSITYGRVSRLFKYALRVRRFFSLESGVPEVVAVVGESGSCRDEVESAGVGWAPEPYMARRGLYVP